MQNGRLPSVQDLVTWIVRLNDRCKQYEDLLGQQKQINQQVKADMATLLQNQNDLNGRILRLETLLNSQPTKVPAGPAVDVPEGAEPADLAEGETYVEPAN